MTSLTYVSSLIPSPSLSCVSEGPPGWGGEDGLNQLLQQVVPQVRGQRWLELKWIGTAVSSLADRIGPDHWV